MPKRKQIDWETVEREYRAGQLSISELARQHDCSRTAIQKRAKAYGWKRDLSDRVRQLVAQRLVDQPVAGCTPISEKEHDIINAAASRGVEVVRQHRQLIGKTIELANRILTQIDADSLSGGTNVDKHSQAFRTLRQGLAKVIPLERQAFNLDGKSSVEKMTDTLADVLTAVAGATRGLPNRNQGKIRE